MPKGKNIPGEVTEMRDFEAVETLIEEVKAPTEFRVSVKNHCSYPVRVLLYANEETGKSTYSVFKSFESRELTINLLTYRHLQRDPKVHMSKIGG